MLPSTVSTSLPYLEIVCEKVPASNWNMPRPPCLSEHGPSPAPATTGPPPQSADAGPLHAHVSSLQQCESCVSALAMPAIVQPLVMPRDADTSRRCVARSRRCAE